MIGRVDHESLDPTDRAVSGVDVLAAAHLHLTFGYAGLGGHLGGHAHAAHAHAAHAHAAHADAAHAANAHATHAAHTHAEREGGQRQHLPLPITPLSGGS